MIVAVEIFIVLLLFTGNGLFAVMEMAVVSSRKSRLKQMAEAGDARPLVALGLAEAPNRFLPTGATVDKVLITPQPMPAEKPSAQLAGNSP